MYYKRKSKIFDIARKMPPLNHSVKGEVFDIRKSQVLQWLIKQPEVLNYIWNKLKNSGDVIYDEKSGTWRGADYKKF